MNRTLNCYHSPGARPNHNIYPQTFKRDMGWKIHEHLCPHYLSSCRPSPLAPNFVTSNNFAETTWTNTIKRHMCQGQSTLNTEYCTSTRATRKWLLLSPPQTKIESSVFDWLSKKWTNQIDRSVQMDQSDRQLQFSPQFFNGHAHKGSVHSFEN